MSNSNSSSGRSCKLSAKNVKKSKTTKLTAISEPIFLKPFLMRSAAFEVSSTESSPILSAISDFSFIVIGLGFGFGFDDAFFSGFLADAGADILPDFLFGLGAELFFGFSSFFLPAFVGFLGGGTDVSATA